MKLNALRVVLLCLLLSAIGWAQGTRTWEQAKYDEFEKGTAHGVAIALMLSHVVRWNTPAAGAVYQELHPSLPERLDELAGIAGLATRLSKAGVPHDDIPALAEAAAQQWTGRFNPRPFDAAAALEIYECAY